MHITRICSAGGLCVTYLMTMCYRAAVELGVVVVVVVIPFGNSVVARRITYIYTHTFTCAYRVFGQVMRVFFKLNYSSSEWVSQRKREREGKRTVQVREGKLA